MKKLFITILIISLLNLVSCYYQEQMNPSNYNYDEMEELWLTTKDTTYILGGKDYYFDNDTLFATVLKKLDRKTTFRTNIEIPVENIKSVEVERTNTALTISAGFGIVLGVLVVAVIFDSV